MFLQFCYVKKLGISQFATSFATIYLNFCVKPLAASLFLYYKSIYLWSIYVRHLLLDQRKNFYFIS